MDKLKKIYDLLALMALNFDKPQKPERLKLYCEHLEEFSFKDIESAIKWHMAHSKFFPQLAEIRSRINPSLCTDLVANEMAGAIMECAMNSGQYDSEKAKEKLGAVAWMAATKMGWDWLRGMTNNQVTTTRAQLREYCKVALNVYERDPSQCKLQFQKTAHKELRGEELKKVEFNGIA